MPDTPLYADAFAYPDGDLTGNGSWIARRGGLFGSLLVSSGELVTDTPGRSNTLSLADQTDVYAKCDLRYDSAVAGGSVVYLYIRDSDAPTAAAWESVIAYVQPNAVVGNALMIQERRAGVTYILAAMAYNDPDAPVWSPGVARTIEIRAVGTAVSLLVDGVELLSGTAGASFAGKPALYTIKYNAHIPVCDNFEYGTISAASGIVHPVIGSGIINSRAIVRGAA